MRPPEAVLLKRDMNTQQILDKKPQAACAEWHLERKNIRFGN